MELKIAGRQIESPLKAVGKAGEPIALVFKMPRYYEGKDLSNGTIYMAVVKDAESQTHVLDKVVLENEIQAIWNGSFNFPGAITVALKISDMEAELWKSYPVAMTVAEGEARPMMMRSFAAPRIAVPDDEEPITVSERTIVIPTELQNIAVQNDENSETVKIVIPRYFDGHDLDQYTAVLKTVSSGGRDDLNLVKIGTDDSELTFEWTLAPPQTSYAGKLEIQIRFVGEDFKWETDSAIVNIITSLDDDPIVPTTPSIIESLIQQVSSYANSASASAALAINSAQEAKEAAEAVGETVDGLVNDAQNAADRAESAATRAENVQFDGDTIIASARAQATAAANSATQAAIDADRAELAADKAEQIAGGDFATPDELNVVREIAEGAREATESKAPKIMVVTISTSSSVLTADKSYAEIISHVNAGGVVVAQRDERWFSLHEITDTKVEFAYLKGTSYVSYSISASGVVSSAPNTLMSVRGGTFTGTVNAPTVVEETNDTQIATTAFVQTAVKKGATVVLTHAKNGTVHALTGMDDRSGIVTAAFLATADFAEGDVFTVDAVTYTAQTLNGETLSTDGFFAANAVVVVAIDTAEHTLTFSGSGSGELPYTYGTTDLTAGTSPLADGAIHLVYE